MRLIQRSSLNVIEEFVGISYDIGARSIEYAPIKFEVADDLSFWSAEIPEKVVAKAEALAGPMTPPGKRVQTINAPESVCTVQLRKISAFKYAVLLYYHYS